MPLPSDTHVVLMLPEASCPTGPVYKAFDASRPDASLQEARVRDMARRASAPGVDEPFNDLAEPAMEVAPRLRGEREEIQEMIDRPVHVSGSGSTLFFLANGAAEAELLAGAVGQRMGIPAVPAQVIHTPAPSWIRRPGS
jgi:4-diphosphocytidyl-2C-methyl-D-erythritol kinase